MLEGAESYAKAVRKGLVLRYNLRSPLSRVKEATLVCHMAGTMKFSEVPTYPYTCRSLHHVRTGKMRTKPPFADAATAHAEERDTFATLRLAFFAHFSEVTVQIPLHPRIPN